jgi:ABC-type branched-subunit amino acid transport system ATPase component/branched-subunit amino acid ABC-type transport system permease component
MLPFIISGLVTGAVYGLAAVGLVLTYKTSGVFNFAHGALATFTAYLFYALHVKAGLNWPLTAFICVFVAGPILAMGFERLAKVLTGRSLALAVTSTVGVLLIVESAALLIYPQTEERVIPVFLGTGQFTILGTTVEVSQLITFLVAILATGLLYVFFRVSRLGAAMRGVVEAPDLLEMSGTSATAVRRWAWLIGVCFAAASGVLFATLTQLDPVLLTLIVVQAFAAAALGAFTSLPLTFAGGLLIGVGSSVATKYFTSTNIWSGIPSALPFIVLFVVLLVFPRRYFRERSLVVPAVRPTWTSPLPVQLGGGTLLLIGLALVPTFAGIHLVDWTVAVAYIILFLSLGLLVRTSGQVSLCHVTFMAIGAVAFGHFTSSGDLPWLPALIVSVAIVIPIGAVLAIPAIRLSPLYLALATLGFGLFVQYMFYTQSFMFGATQDGIPMARPTWLGLGGDKGFYYLVLILACLSCLVVIVLNRSRFGRLLRAMADSPTAVETSGSAVRVTRVLVFCISAALAAFAGILVGVAQQSISIVSYPPLLSLTYLALVLIVAGGVPWYAVMAGLLWVLPPAYISSENTVYWLQILFGVSALAYAFTPDSARGVPAPIARRVDAIFRRRPAEAPSRDLAAPVATGANGKVTAGSLHVGDVSMRFGGLVAVQGVTLEAPTGRITGVIGPNGAGKSTTFNVCSGLLSPTSGRVLLDGDDVTRNRPSTRARRGLGRTFQQLQLFDSLSVWENVSIGAEASLAGANAFRHVVSSPKDGQHIHAAVAGALEMCQISDLADRPAGSLSTGQRRLVELARCAAGPFRILLLDEPSSGLDRAETAQFGAILRRLVADRGVGILLVEHDMSLVMDICEYIYVLDFGRIIYEGTPSQIVGASEVQAAYLGFADDTTDSPAAPPVATEAGA